MLETAWNSFCASAAALGLQREASDAVGLCRAQNPDLRAGNLVDEVFLIPFSNPSELQRLESRLREAGLPD